MIKCLLLALAGVAQGNECWIVNQGVAGSIPGQGMCLGGRLGPQWGALERQPHIDVSSSLPLSKNKQIKYFLKLKCLLS